jgi:hypothetical protein
MSKLNLSKLEDIPSPEKLDKHILSAAKKHSNLKVSFFKKTGGYAIAYCFGLLSIAFSGLLIDSLTNNIAPTITLSHVTLRGAENQQLQRINVNELSETERKDLLIELVIKNELQQAEALINWMNKQKEK